jgi:DedD protein
MGFFTRKEDEAESADVGIKRPRARRTSTKEALLDPLDPLQLAKRRARRRLIGAVALVLGAVVLLPMVFDKEPKTRTDDLSVEIPSQNSSFNPPLVAPSSGTATPATPQNALVPGAPLGDAVPVTASATPPAGSAVNSAANAPAGAPATLSANPAESAGPASLSGSGKATVASLPQSRASDTKPADLKATDTKATDKSAALKTANGKDAPGHDDPRALAALEGKSLAPTSGGEEARASEKFAVQIGAFSNADKVKEVRDRLTAAGLKPYTENLSTAQGPRTRVRVGPFSTREAADEARDKVKGLGFDGSVVTL